MELRDLTVTGFCTETISSSPAPGGGSVAALCGALAASLSGMVGELTIGKKGYEEQEAQMQAILAQAKSLQNELLLAIDEDSCSFNGYMTALKLPKNTEEEKAIRQAAMQEGLKAAAIVPMHTAELAAKIFPLARFAVERGNENALSDGLVSAMTARTAVLSALLNVRINLGSIKDEAFVWKLSDKCNTLWVNALAEEKEILALAAELTE